MSLLGDYRLVYSLDCWPRSPWRDRVRRLSIPNLDQTRRMSFDEYREPRIDRKVRK